jgi:integrase
MLPTVKQIAAEHSVSVGTAHRALGLLTEEGRVIVSRGVRAVVASSPTEDPETDSWAK